MSSSELYRKLIAILKEHGCAFLRQGKGDHEFWHSYRNGHSFPVDRGMKSRHTANAVLKQAGIQEKIQ